MRKILKVPIVAVAVVLAALASLLPLTSYAQEPAPVSPKTKTSTVSVGVAPILSLEIDITEQAEAGSNNGMAFELSPYQMAEGTFTAKVTSNKAYTISLSANNSKDATSALAGPDNARIPSVANITEGSTGWGVRLVSSPKSDDNSQIITNTDTSYKAVSTSLTRFVTSSVPSSTAGSTSTFKVGVAVGSGLAVGEYSGTLVVTASNSANPSP